MSVRQRRKQVAVPFNLMVAGHARTGKSAYMHTLYVFDIVLTIGHAYYP
jgi:septin family protein